MKKVNSLLTAFIFFLLCSACNFPQSNVVIKEKTSQEKFFDVMKWGQDERYNQPNDVKMDEFETVFDKKLTEFFDTLKPLQGWKATIKGIKTKRYGKSEVLRFDLLMNIQEHQQVTFEVMYPLTGKNKSADSLYQKVTRLHDYSTVIFDGFPRTMLSKDLYFRGDKDAPSHTYYPYIGFFVTDIAPVGQKDTMSTALLNAYKLTFEKFENVRKDYVKEISKLEYKNEKSRIAKELNEARAKIITEQEKSILKIADEAAAMNFAWAAI